MAANFRDGTLGRAEQSALLVDVKQRLKDADSRQDALDLLRKLRGRTDLLASVAEEIDATLARSAEEDEHARVGGAAGAGPLRGETPLRPVQKSEPVTPPTMTLPEAAGIGRRLLRWALYGFLALVGLVIAAQMAQQRTVVPLPVGVLPQVEQLACCDFTGVKRCPMAVQLPLGSQCFCPGQGVGITCQ